MKAFWSAMRDKGWTQERFAGELGITQAAVGQWKRIPPGRLLEVAALSGIPIGKLRPDLKIVVVGEAA